jgi:hypothetical protein
LFWVLFNALLAEVRTEERNNVRAAGWLALVWLDLASGPMERCDIVVPFVAATVFSTRRMEASRMDLLPCIRNIDGLRPAVDQRRHC